jgi:hypothetical protein
MLVTTIEAAISSVAVTRAALLLATASLFPYSEQMLSVTTRQQRYLAQTALPALMLIPTIHTY